jgi:4-hydroxy-tetrahydrodipicolinate synthase
METKSIMAVGGNWPVMITPFNEDKSIDWASLDNLIEWYINADINGLFAVCQSSEMFDLTNQERLDLAKHVLKRVNNRVPVIATGTFPDNQDNQVEMVKKMYDIGIEIIVILSNVFATAQESDSVWKEKVGELLTDTENIPLGLYECPYPYKRLVPPETMSWIVNTKRFFWSKDTSESITKIKERLKVLEHSDLSLYNAHTGSLLESLQAGVLGFAGIDSNYFPQLYSWMCKNWKNEPELAVELQEFFIKARKIIDHKYPLSSKEYLLMKGIIKNSTTRLDKEKFNQDEIEKLRQMSLEVESWEKKLSITSKETRIKTPELSV